MVFTDEEVALGCGTGTRVHLPAGVTAGGGTQAGSALHQAAGGAGRQPLRVRGQHAGPRQVRVRVSCHFLPSTGREGRPFGPAGSGDLPSPPPLPHLQPAISLRFRPRVQGGVRSHTKRTCMPVCARARTQDAHAHSGRRDVAGECSFRGGHPCACGRFAAVRIGLAHTRKPHASDYTHPGCGF